MDSSPYDIVLKKLEGFIRKYYANKLIKGAIYSGAVFFTAMLLFAGLEYFGRFNGWVRAVMFYSFLILFLGSLLRWVIYPLAQMNKLGRSLDHHSASIIIGRHFAEVKDKLLNILQLKEQEHANHVSLELANASIDQKIAEIAPLPFQMAVDFRKNKQFLKYLLIPAGIVLLLSLVSPDYLLEPSERILKYSNEFIPEAPFSLVLLNDDTTVPKNEDLQLIVGVKGSVQPKQAFLEIEGQKLQLRKSDEGDFAYELKNIQNDLSFRFFADGIYSERYDLKVLPNPILLDLSLDLTYPPYLGIENQKIEHVGDLKVPEGTVVKWSLTTESTEELGIIWQGEKRAAKKVGKEAFQFERKLLKNSNYSIITANKHMKGRDTIDYSIRVVPDEYPSIFVEALKDSSEGNQDFLIGEIQDDYGFKSLNCYYRLIQDGSRVQDEFEMVPISFDVNSRQTKFYFELNQLKSELKPGVSMQYYFEVGDNDAVNGSKKARTNQQIWSAPTEEALKASLDKKSESFKENIAETAKEAMDLKKELAELNRKLIDKKKATWQDKEQLRQLLDRQNELQKKVEELDKELERNLSFNNEIKQSNENLLEKQQELKALMEKVMSDEMRKKMEEIRELMDQLDKEKLMEKLEDLEVSNEDLEKELERSLELFKQLEVEQQLEEAIEKLDELKREQEELKNKSENANREDMEKLSEQQDMLNEEFEKLTEDMEKLREKNDELEFPNEMENTESLEESIKQDMKESSESLQQKKKSQASENQKDAQEGMEEMSQAMNMMQQNMQQQNAEDVDALRQILDNIVTSSFDQEDLMNRLKGISNRDPKYVDAMIEQNTIKDNLEVVRDSLYTLSKRIAELEPTINKELSNVNRNIDKAIKDLQERKTGASRSRQQLAMTSLNNLALLLDEVVQQLQQQMASQMSGKGSCNKPGGKKAKPGSMSDMQKMLNEQLKALKESMSKGKKPGGKPGAEGSQGSMSKELARMAARQAALREELKKLSDNGEGKGGDGNKGKLSDLMEQTETDIVNRKITSETIRRQEEILTRLLESEKAEKEREWDNKRESKEAGEREVGRNEKFLEYYREKQQEIELLRTLTPAYNDFYKGKVSDYFKNIAE